MKAIAVCCLAVTLALAAAVFSAPADLYSTQLKSQLETAAGGTITGFKTNTYFPPASLTQRLDMTVRLNTGQMTTRTLEVTVGLSGGKYFLQSMAVIDSAASAMRKQVSLPNDQVGLGGGGGGTGGTSTTSSSSTTEACKKKCFGTTGTPTNWFDALRCYLLCLIGITS